MIMGIRTVTAIPIATGIVIATRIRTRRKAGRSRAEATGALRRAEHSAVIPRAGGVSSTPRRLDVITTDSEYWIARSSRAMTVEFEAHGLPPFRRCEVRHGRHHASQRRIKADLSLQHLDVQLLMWDMRRNRDKRDASRAVPTASLAQSSFRPSLRFTEAILLRVESGRDA